MISYLDVIQLNGKTCFTLTQNKPALVRVDEQKVIIEYPSGNKIDIPRTMIENALYVLQITGILSLEDVHENITRHQGPLTDRLLAVLRELPGITFSPSPRAIYLKEHES